MTIGKLLHHIYFKPSYDVIIYTGYDLSSVSFELWKGKDIDVPPEFIGYDILDWSFWSEVEHGVLTIVVSVLR